MADPIRKLVTELVFKLVGAETADRVSEKLVQSLLQAVRQTDRLAEAQERAQARIRVAEEGTERARLMAQARIRAADVSEQNSIRQRLTQTQRLEDARQTASERHALAQQRLEQMRAANAQRAADSARRLDAQQEAFSHRKETAARRFDAQQEQFSRRAAQQDIRIQQAAERAAAARMRAAENQEEREAARQERIAARRDRQEMQLRLAAERSVERERIRAERAVQREIAETRREARELRRELRHGAGELTHIGGILGLAYTGHQITEMADQWAFITSSIRNVSANDTDATRTREALFRTSQESGLGMEGVARLYNQLAMNREETHLTPDQIQDITRTVSRGLSLNHGTNSQNLRAIRQFDEMLSAGRLNLQHMNALRNDNPYLAGIMAQAAGGTNALNERIHSRQADMPFILDLITKMRAIVDRDFNHIQTTFGMAYERIRNALMRLMGEFLINNRVISTGLDALTNTVTGLITAIEKAAAYLGGFDQALQVGLALLAALTGPAVISGLTALGVFFWELLLPWVAMSAAIGAVILVLQDIWSWANGKRSIMGMIFGDYGLYKAQIEGIGRSLMHLLGLDGLTRYGTTLQGILRAVREGLENIQKDPGKQWWLMRDMERALAITQTILNGFNYVKGTLDTFNRYDPTQWLVRQGERMLGYNGQAHSTTIHMPVTVTVPSNITDPHAIGEAAANSIGNRMTTMFGGRPSSSRTAFPSLEIGGAR